MLQKDLQNVRVKRLKLCFVNAFALLLFMFVAWNKKARVFTPPSISFRRSLSKKTTQKMSQNGISDEPEISISFLFGG